MSADPTSERCCKEFLQSTPFGSEKELTELAKRTFQVAELTDKQVKNLQRFYKEYTDRYEKWARKGIGTFPCQKKSKDPQFSELVSVERKIKNKDGTEVKIMKKSWLPFIDTPASPEKRAYWAKTYQNYCVIAGYTMLILDIESEEAARRLFTNFDELLKEHYVVQTGKGYHVYFFAEGYPVKHGHVYDKEDIDTRELIMELRHGNSYVMGEGSLHPSGRIYTAIGASEPAKLVHEAYLELEQRILEQGWLLPNEKEPRAPMDWNVEKIDIPTYLKEETERGVKKGRGRNSARFILTLKLAGCGRTDDEIHQLISHFNTKCEEPDDQERVTNQVSQILEGIKNNVYDPIPPIRPAEPDEELATVDVPMLYDLGHTPFANAIEEDLCLEGANYRLAIKAISYHVLGRKYLFRIERGGVYDDSRVNPLYAISSGGGKNNILTTTSVAFAALGIESGYVTSLHPEQLIGRFEYNKKIKQYEEIQGWLRKPTLQFDEVWSLLAGKAQHSEECWKYLCKALDPIGRNRVEKKLTCSHKALSFEPDCTLSACVQPRAIPADVVQQGLFRRFTCVFIDARMVDEQEAFLHRLTREKNPHTNLHNRLKDWNMNHGEIPTPKLPRDINFDLKLCEYQTEIISYMRSRGEKGKRLAEILRFPIQNQILKFATILAAYNRRDTIEQVDLDNAFIDAFEFVESGCRYVENCVAASLDYGGDWGGATGNYQQALRLLAQNGAISYETGMTHAAFHKLLTDEHVFEVHDASVLRKRIKILKDNNWVKSSHGRGVSAVWLAFPPPVLENVVPFDVNTSNYLRLHNMSGQSGLSGLQYPSPFTPDIQRERGEYSRIYKDNSTTLNSPFSPPPPQSPHLSKQVLQPTQPSQPTHNSITSERQNAGFGGAAGVVGADGAEGAAHAEGAVDALRKALIVAGTLGISAALLRDQWGEGGYAAAQVLSERGEAYFVAETGKWFAKTEPNGGVADAE